MQLHTRVLTAASVATLIAVLGSARPTIAFAQGSAPKLDDPTIVAIFDAANTYDMQNRCSCGQQRSLQGCPRFWQNAGARSS